MPVYGSLTNPFNIFHGFEIGLLFATTFINNCSLRTFINVVWTRFGKLKSPDLLLNPLSSFLVTLLNFYSKKNFKMVWTNLEPRILYSKSSIVGVNKSSYLTNLVASTSLCKPDLLPLNYLGLSSGANPKHLKIWKLVIDRVEKELAS